MRLSEYESGFVDLSPAENRLLGQLLAVDFPGVAELREQARALTAKPLDLNGSVRLAVSTAEPAQVKRRIPVEGTYIDHDGVRVNVLLHVVDGYLDELEIYRDDSASVQRRVSSSPDINIL